MRVCVNSLQQYSYRSRASLRSCCSARRIDRKAANLVTPVASRALRSDLHNKEARAQSRGSSDRRKNACGMGVDDADDKRDALTWKS